MQKGDAALRPFSGPQGLWRQMRLVTTIARKRRLQHARLGRRWEEFDVSIDERGVNPFVETIESPDVCLVDEQAAVIRKRFRGKLVVI